MTTVSTGQAGSLALSGIVKRYDSAPVVRGVSFSLRAGEVTALLGHNGAGKSTALKILGGAEQPSGGHILLDGEAVTLTTPRIAEAHGIAVVWQELRIIEKLTVTQNFFLNREKRRGPFTDRTAMNEHVRRALATYGLAADPDMAAGALSPADRQMLEIIIALDKGGRFLLLDEPTSALNASEITRLLDTVRRLAAGGTSIAIVTHKLGEALAVADHVVVMKDGYVVLDAERADLSEADLAYYITGHRRDATPLAEVSPRTAFGGTTLLDIRTLSSGNCRSASLEINAGRVVGLYGVAGAGQVELLEVLFGVRPMQGGEIRLAGEPYVPTTPRAALAKGFGFLTDDRKANGFIPDMTIGKNIVLASIDRFSRGIWFDDAAVAEQARTMAARLAIRSPLGTSVRRLSGGNQQKVIFAKWVTARSRILLLAEPTKGVDIGAKAEIHALIRELAAAGDTLLVCSSEIEEILEVSDVIYVFRHGICEGTGIPRAEAEARSILAQSL
ncbi:MAG: sugar ABC transporter ATP-binding protein [Rhodospirillales bacterium]|nr:sugar ABC transporter ATP-binding protein [Rhodospirillales bacterium]